MLYCVVLYLGARVGDCVEVEGGCSKQGISMEHATSMNVATR